MKLVLSDTLRQELEHAAQAELPRECCGLIEGVAEKDGFRATKLHIARNLAAVPDRFEIDPADHIAAAKSARGRGRHIIGCYHSHPHGTAEPSSSDLAGGAEENFLWLIWTPEALRAFVYSAAGFGRIGLATGADFVTSSS